MSEIAKPVQVGTAIAQPGQMVRGVIPVTTLAGGAAAEIPVIVIAGAKPGPCLWVDGGIHGDEPEGPLTCQILAREVDPAQLSGSLVLVPVMNVAAFEAGQRGNPLDTFSHDMNRIYPGRAGGYFTERVAWAHAEWMRKVADMEVSIHSGGSHSTLCEMIFVVEDKLSIEMARAMGKGWLLALSAVNPKGNPMAVMQDAGKAGITVELGGRAATSPEAMRQVARILADAMLNMLRHFKMLPGTPTYPEIQYCGVQEALLAPVSGMFIPAPGVALKKPMKAGDPLASIVNLFGDTLAELVAPADGMPFGLRAMVSVTTGDWCCFYAKTAGTR